MKVHFEEEPHFENENMFLENWKVINPFLSNIFQKSPELYALEPVDKSTHPLNRLENALKSFIDFLSDGLISKMPAYDGVVLLCQSEEDIVYLNRALKQISQLKLNLEARFKLVVKGMGDLKSFVTRDYPKYLSYVDDLKFPVKKWSDSRARDMSELLNRLIGKIILKFYQKDRIVHNEPKIKKSIRTIVWENQYWAGLILGL